MQYVLGTAVDNLDSLALATTFAVTIAVKTLLWVACCLSLHQRINQTFGFLIFSGHCNKNILRIFVLHTVSLGVSLFDLIL